MQAVEEAIATGDVGFAVPNDRGGVEHFAADAVEAFEFALAGNLIEIEAAIVADEDGVVDKDGRGNGAVREFDFIEHQGLLATAIEARALVGCCAESRVVEDAQGAIHADGAGEIALARRGGTIAGIQRHGADDATVPFVKGRVGPGEIPDHGVRAFFLRVDFHHAALPGDELFFDA